MQALGLAAFSFCMVSPHPFSSEIVFLPLQHSFASCEMLLLQSRGTLGTLTFASTFHSKYQKVQKYEEPNTISL